MVSNKSFIIEYCNSKKKSKICCNSFYELRKALTDIAALTVRLVGGMITNDPFSQFLPDKNRLNKAAIPKAFAIDLGLEVSLV